MDLPIFNRNSGGKKRALEKVNYMVKKYDSYKKDVGLDLESFKIKYTQFVRSLKSMVSKYTLNNKHNKIERYYQRGIIPISIVIESHRQLVEFSSTRFEAELGAVEALWNIYKINGEIDKKFL